MHVPELARRVRLDRAPPRYAVRLSHDDLLLPPVATQVSAGCDAVLVPTHDLPERLRFAVGLAGDLGCPLLVLATQGRERPVVDVLHRHGEGVDAAVLALPHGGPMPADGPTPVPQLSSWREPGARPTKYRDVSLKRNTGLAAARLLGWRDVLFLDDDIIGLTAGLVRTAFAGLGDVAGRRAAGWKVTDFPDNSAVCFAGRLVGNEQGIFVGSGALALRLEGPVPLFPPVYNEDWCFLFESLVQRRVVVAGEVRQLRYNPFDAVANRGGNEEFGDVLGEGLFHLVHAGHDWRPALDPAYWRGVVSTRRTFILDVRSRLADELRRAGAVTAGGHDLREALACLDQALRQHRHSLPDRLASFVGAWADDLARWRPWYDGLPVVGELAEAVRLLGWPPEVLHR